MLGLDISRWSRAVNLSWLLLVLGLGLTETSCCLCERILEVMKQEPRPAIHMEKQLVRACKLIGAESGNLQRGVKQC